MINLTNTYLHCLKLLKIISSDNLTLLQRFTIVSTRIYRVQLANIAAGILYASTSLSHDVGFKLLQKAIDTLLAVVEVSPCPDVLWSVQYLQHASSGTDKLPTNKERIISFSPPSVDLAFDDAILDSVKGLWRQIVGDEGGEFLVFQDRELYDDDE